MNKQPSPFGRVLPALAFLSILVVGAPPLPAQGGPDEEKVERVGLHIHCTQLGSRIQISGTPRSEYRDHLICWSFGESLEQGSMTQVQLRQELWKRATLPAAGDPPSLVLHPHANLFCRDVFETARTAIESGFRRIRFQAPPAEFGVLPSGESGEMPLRLAGRLLPGPGTPGREGEPTGQGAGRPPLLLYVTQRGRVILAGETLYDPLRDPSRKRLREKLRGIAGSRAARVLEDSRGRREGPILVQGDLCTPWYHLAKVLEACRDEGLHDRKIVLAVGALDSTGHSTPKPVAEKRKSIALLLSDTRGAGRAIHRGLQSGINRASGYELFPRSYEWETVTLASVVRALQKRKVPIYITLSVLDAIQARDILAQESILFIDFQDPIASGLVGTGGTDAQVTGVRAHYPFRENFALIRNLLPLRRDLAILHDPGHSLRSAPMTALCAFCIRYGFMPHWQPLEKKGGSAKALAALAGKVDAMVAAFAFHPMFPAAYRDCGDLVGFCLDRKLPLFILGDPDWVGKGALASVAPDYEGIGVEAARIVNALIAGKKPRDLPFRHFRQGILHLNRKTAETIGLRLPEKITESAGRIYEATRR